ncbi:MAG: hypothetical protein HGA65_13935, partial [Oscillochloris sp.]|nr:hypothetical protein [Oscillochloris sp.]
LALALLALLLLPFDIALRRLLLHRSDLGAAGQWLAARRPSPPAPAPAQSDPTLDRLAEAKRRAAARISGRDGEQ